MSTVPASYEATHALVRYAVGEGIEPGDFNDAQRFGLTRMTDLIIAGGDYDGDGLGVVGASPSEELPDHAYVPRMGQAIMAEGTGGLDMTTGWIGQKVTPGTFGLDPRILMARIDNGAGTHFVFDTGDGSPRVDLVQVRLTEVDGDSQLRDFEDGVTRALTSTATDKKTRVQVEWNIKNGTPAATPQIPAADAGWVPVYAVRVPIGYSGTPDMDDIYDMRMPMRVQQYRIPRSSFFTETASQWDLSDGISLDKIVAGTAQAMAETPIMHGRILGVWLMARVHADGNEGIKLASYDYDSNYAEISDLDSIGVIDPSPQFGYLPTPLSTEGTQKPLWCNVYGPHQALWAKDTGYPLGLYASPVHNRMVLSINGGISATKIFDAGLVIASDL